MRTAARKARREFWIWVSLAVFNMFSAVVVAHQWMSVINVVALFLCGWCARSEWVKWREFRALDFFDRLRAESGGEL